MAGAQEPAHPEGESRFSGGVDLVSVTATVTDEDGHFIQGLTRDDFIVYDDERPQEIASFTAGRVPVSLGIALDTSGSMTAPKMAAARGAIDRFSRDLLDPRDELFFLKFSSRAELVQRWTTDRRAISRAVADVSPGGGTALYDAIADALPIAASGRHRKTALLVISDGNDTSSDTPVPELRRKIRDGDVLVYALGVDGPPDPFDRATPRRPVPSFPPRTPLPIPLPGRPFPFPGRRPPGRRPQVGAGPGAAWTRSPSARLDEAALRAVTDETGGRTEIIRSFADLDGATSRLADELNRQYELGYVGPNGKDNRWHAIRVETRNPRLRVRARRGYLAS